MCIPRNGAAMLERQYDVGVAVVLPSPDSRPRQGWQYNCHPNNRYRHPNNRFLGLAYVRSRANHRREPCGCLPEPNLPIVLHLDRVQEVVCPSHRLLEPAMLDQVLTQTLPLGGKLLSVSSAGQ